jgi:hypothetical protein
MTVERTPQTYVEQAREDLHNYGQGLLAENERLRGKVAALESEKRQLESGLEEGMSELGRLRVRLEEIQQDNQEYSDEFQRIEQQSGNLANLYVASYQLHSTVDRDAVLRTIQEIVINLIGSEEIAIFECDDQGRFRVISSTGIDDYVFAPFRIGEGPIGRHLFDGEVYVNRSTTMQPDGLTGCVPLKIGDRTIGAIAVFRLLAHKSGLERLDHELFALLAVHAATALYCSMLHEQASKLKAVAS